MPRVLARIKPPSRHTKVGLEIIPRNVVLGMVKLTMIIIKYRPTCTLQKSVKLRFLLRKKKRKNSLSSEIFLIER